MTVCARDMRGIGHERWLVNNALLGAVDHRAMALRNRCQARRAVVTEAWATLAEAATHLQVAEKTVHRWIHKTTAWIGHR